MRPIAALLAGVALGVTATLHAQEKRPLIGRPMLLLQPGLITTGFLDQPPGVQTDLQVLARFLTTVPIGLPRTRIVAIVQWTPLKGEGGRLGAGQSNSLMLSYGAVVHLVGSRYVDFDGDALVNYAPDPTGSSNYSHQLHLEGDLYFNVGNWAKLKHNWQYLSAYVDFSYQLTGRPQGESYPAFHRAVLLSGVSLPIAPWNSN